MRRHRQRHLRRALAAQPGDVPHVAGGVDHARGLHRQQARALHALHQLVRFVCVEHGVLRHGAHHVAALHTRPVGGGTLADRSHTRALQRQPLRGVERVCDEADVLGVGGGAHVCNQHRQVTPRVAEGNRHAERIELRDDGPRHDPGDAVEPDPLLRRQPVHLHQRALAEHVRQAALQLRSRRRRRRVVRRRERPRRLRRRDVLEKQRDGAPRRGEGDGHSSQLVDVADHGPDVVVERPPVRRREADGAHGRAGRDVHLRAAEVAEGEGDRLVVRGGDAGLIGVPPVQHALAAVPPAPLVAFEALDPNDVIQAHRTPACMPASCSLEPNAPPLLRCRPPSCCCCCCC
eukprot:Rhum_TRINITY_DN9907_c0_g1::Rhum_TRINITY_DN9907_c0_g1_i1::g.35891::m.35891